MSRTYEMDVTVTGVPEDRADLVIEACCEEWGFDRDSLWQVRDSDNGLATISMQGIESLCGGESEGEFATRLADAVWVANNGRCRVEVRATCLDEIPSEMYIRE